MKQILCIAALAVLIGVPGIIHSQSIFDEAGLLDTTVYSEISIPLMVNTIKQLAVVYVVFPTGDFRTGIRRKTRSSLSTDHRGGYICLGSSSQTFFIQHLASMKHQRQCYFG